MSEKKFEINLLVDETRTMYIDTDGMSEQDLFRHVHCEVLKSNILKQVNIFYEEIKNGEEWKEDAPLLK